MKTIRELQEEYSELEKKVIDGDDVATTVSHLLPPTSDIPPVPRDLLNKRIQCKWGSRWYNGLITEYTGGTFKVIYDDGDKRNYNIDLKNYWYSGDHKCFNGKCTNGSSTKVTLLNDGEYGPMNGTSVLEKKKRKLLKATV